MSRFNLFTTEPALAIEHMFNFHGFDPVPRQMGGGLPYEYEPTINPGDISTQRGRLTASQSMPPPVRLAPATGLQQLPNATPSQAPTMAPIPNANPYQQYLNQLPNAPASGLPSPPPDLRQAVTRASQEQGIPPSILYGISGAESVNPNSMQWQNARGADRHGQGYFQFDDRYYPQSGQFNPYDPYQAATKAATKFKGDVNYFQSNPQAGMSPVEAAMRAYNAGRGGHLRAPTPSQDYQRFTRYAGANQ